MTTQTKWRIVGGVAISLCAVMAWGGVNWDFPRRSPLYFCIYWAVFIILFLAALIVAWLDMRYVRTIYSVEKKQAFRETLGDAGFREALRAAQLQTDKDERQSLN